LVKGVTGVERRFFLVALSAIPFAGCRETRDTPFNKSKKTARPLKGDLVELVAIDPTIRLDLRYATPNNFTGRILYDQARAFLWRGAALALVRAHHRAAKDGFGLTIFDAYRPWRVTKALWDATQPADRNYVANPKKGSRHNRGCAVDLSLHTLETGALVEMPSAFDDFSQRAHRDFAGASAAAIENRERLARCMQAEGFRGMSNEWWHFDFDGWEAHPVLDVPFGSL
jgi:D-alanyl-D-alanine dipeptidase